MPDNNALDQAGLRELAIAPGAVFLGPWAQPIKAKFDLFVVDNMKYCGILNEADLIQVQQRIIASGNLTVDEMNSFFGKK